MATTQTTDTETLTTTTETQTTDTATPRCDGCWGDPADCESHGPLTAHGHYRYCAPCWATLIAR